MYYVFCMMQMVCHYNTKYLNPCIAYTGCIDRLDILILFPTRNISYVLDLLIVWIYPSNDSLILFSYLSNVECYGCIDSLGICAILLSMQ